LALKWLQRDSRVIEFNGGVIVSRFWIAEFLRNY
jgi:hypothetical protein